jgi:hypothetical protein
MHIGFATNLTLKYVHTYFISLQSDLYYIGRHSIHVASVYSILITIMQKFHIAAI